MDTQPDTDNVVYVPCHFFTIDEWNQAFKQTFRQQVGDHYVLVGTDIKNHIDFNEDGMMALLPFITNLRSYNILSVNETVIDRILVCIDTCIVMSESIAGKRLRNICFVNLSQEERKFVNEAIALEEPNAIYSAMEEFRK